MLTHITFAISALAQATAACTRETLKAITDEHPYIHREPQEYPPRIKHPFQGSQIHPSRAHHDILQCAAFTEYIVTNAAAPYVSQCKFASTTPQTLLRGWTAL
jgi:hypothetical protein